MAEFNLMFYKGKTLSEVENAIRERKFLECRKTFLPIAAVASSMEYEILESLLDAESFYIVAVNDDGRRFCYHITADPVHVAIIREVT